MTSHIFKKMRNKNVMLSYKIVAWERVVAQTFVSYITKNKSGGSRELPGEERL